MRLALLVHILCAIACSANAQDVSEQEAPASPAQEAEELLRALDVADSLAPQNVLVLDALRNGNVDCAICILEAEIDLAIESAESRLADNPTATLRESLELPLEMLTTYRKRNPWDRSECPDGVCRAPK